MNHQNYSYKAHVAAVEHGFWKKQYSKEHCMMLVITEVAEMVEAHRNKRVANLQQYKREIVPLVDSRRGWFGSVEEPDLFEKYIKDTIADEMADIMLRLYDLAGAIELDFTKYNPIRYQREFDKYEFTENAYSLIKGLANETFPIERRIMFGLLYVQLWAEQTNIPLEIHIRLKMGYNETRGIRHGKEY